MENITFFRIENIGVSGFSVADFTPTSPDNLCFRSSCYILQGFDPQDASRMTKPGNFINLRLSWLFPVQDCDVSDAEIPASAVPLPLGDFTVAGLRSDDRYPEDITFSKRRPRPVDPVRSA